MTKHLLCCFVVAATAHVAHAEGALNEVVPYSEGPDGSYPAAFDRYKPVGHEHQLDNHTAAVGWFPGINEQKPGHPVDLIDVVFAHTGDKVQLVFVTDRGKRTALPIDIKLSELEATSLTFVERPDHKLLVRCSGIAFGQDPGVGGEGYLVSWDAAKHTPVIDKHWRGDWRPEHEPAWAHVTR